MTAQEAYTLGFRQAMQEKRADYGPALVLGALGGGLLGHTLGRQYGYWFSPSPYYRDVNISEFMSGLGGAAGGAVAGAGLSAAALGVLKALGRI